MLQKYKTKLQNDAGFKKMFIIIYNICIIDFLIASSIVLLVY